MAKIDNDKMWESILKAEKPQIRLDKKFTFVTHDIIEDALKDQGLKYNEDTKKIESIEPEPFKLEEGKWYVCMEDIYDHVTDDTIFKEGELFNVFAITPRVRTINDHFKCIDELFRPATPEEIPHSESSQEGLNELEKIMYEDLLAIANVGTDGFISDASKVEYFTMLARDFSKELMDVARKQLQPEIDAEINKAYKNQDKVQYKNGYNKCLEKALTYLYDTWPQIAESPQFIEDFRKALEKGVNDE